VKARTLAAAAAAALLVAAPALAYKLVPHGVRVSVAKSPMTVDPPIDWNRQQVRPGRNAEAWTLDGMPLNEVTFYGGIVNDQALFKEVAKATKPLPRFAATMRAPDVVQLFEASYRVAGGSSLFQVDGVEPATFAGQGGFRFTYTFTLENEEVKRRGEATGAIVGGRLYLITFEAPAIHYFDRDLDKYRALVASARLPVPSVTAG
jgi:hypothetical protein